jgi:hypothetical protein
MRSIFFTDSNAADSTVSDDLENICDPSWTQETFDIFLAEGVVAGPDSQIVRPASNGGFCLGGVVDRNTDDSRWPDETACVAQGHVVLANMNPICADCQSNVDAVVNKLSVVYQLVDNRIAQRLRLPTNGTLYYTTEMKCFSLFFHFFGTTEYLFCYLFANRLC